MYNVLFNKRKTKATDKKVETQVHTQVMAPNIYINIFLLYRWQNLRNCCQLVEAYLR